MSNEVTRRFTLSLVLSLALAAAAVAQMPADAVFQDFKPSGDFVLALGGKDLKSAQLYFAERAGAYLIIAPELSSPILVNTRTQTVENVSMLKIAKRPNGVIDLLADAAFEQIDRFTINGQKLTFKLKGQNAELRHPPALLGLQTAQTLTEHSPSYGFKANEYAFDAGLIAGLKQQKQDVRVRVYFGTWCPVCSRYVPRVLKVASQLEGSKLRFEYYGLPQPMSGDPMTEKDGLKGVPTAIIYVGGVEKGRLDGRDLNQPESAIQRILGAG
jgi:thiol-disulfide isomerase/thioredoxin